jgi:hypothetical protein
MFNTSLLHRRQHDDEDDDEFPHHFRVTNDRFRYATELSIPVWSSPPFTLEGSLPSLAHIFTAALHAWTTLHHGIACCGMCGDVFYRPPHAGDAATAAAAAANETEAHMIGTSACCDNCIIRSQVSGLLDGVAGSNRCAVCLEDMMTRFDSTTVCGQEQHRLHRTCRAPLNQCPMCRRTGPGDDPSFDP